MKIVIQTQHRENYGAHDWDGEGSCPQHWKMKGGNTYVLTGVTVAQAMAGTLDGLVESVIEDRNESWEEYIVGSDLVDDCVEGPFCDSWEAPIMLTLRDGKFHAIHERSFEGRYGICGERKTWVQESGGEQANFLLEYRMEDGSYITYQDWNKRQTA